MRGEGDGWRGLFMTTWRAAGDATSHPTFSRTDSGRLNVFSLINLEINSRSRFTPRQQSNLNCAGSGRWDAHKLRATRWHGNYIEESFLQQDADVSYPEKTLRRIDVFWARRCGNCDNICVVRVPDKFDSFCRAFFRLWQRRCLRGSS